MFAPKLQHMHQVSGHNVGEVLCCTPCALSESLNFTPIREVWSMDLHIKVDQMFVPLEVHNSMLASLMDPGLASKALP